MIEIHTRTIDVSVDGKVYTLSELPTGEVEAFDVAAKSGDGGFGPITRALVASLKAKHPDMTEATVKAFPPRVLHELFEEVFKLVKVDGAGSGEAKAA